jgi:flavin reductase (DIM6/NTAB) family NADH-FMN oxidoreductase RutF
VVAPDEFRRTLSCFASGVTIVTASQTDGQPTGLTASAFSSVSLEPPLVLVCISRGAQSHPAMLASGRFAVNILGADQEAVAQRFAVRSGPGSDKFAGLRWTRGDLGLPLIDGALAQLECSTVQTYAGGDHTIFLGQVERARCCEDRADDPLLYHRGQYARVERRGP